MPYAVHDTTIVDNYIHDTIVVDNYIVDTLTVTDTMTMTDTLYVTDIQVITDTLWLTVHDTVYIHDTIYITPEGIGDMATSGAKIYASGGHIIVESEDGGMLPEVKVYDAVGRMMSGMRRDESGRMRFDTPATGVYVVRIGEQAARRVVVVR